MRKVVPPTVGSAPLVYAAPEAEEVVEAIELLFE
jgi:hypothetical protein